mmetsp:Transcript_43266/g.113680  ORF Transcript_43266/g.113680 Transcript_43266/m.113680 type:complete len:162 (-) Transcript_43266:101-586(-)
MLPPCDLYRRLALSSLDPSTRQYEHAAWDALNLLGLSRPSTLLLFDDQCDPHNCRGPNAAFAVWSTLATCDMEHLGLIELVVGQYNVMRPFALFRRGTTLLNISTTLPCLPQDCPCSWCDVAFTHAPAHAKEFSKALRTRAACRQLDDGRRIITIVPTTVA